MPRTQIPAGAGTRSSMRIAIITDTHYGQDIDHATDYATRFPAMITQINTYHPDFCIVNGDLFDCDDDADVIATVPLGKAAIDKLTCPWVYCYGNHDQEFPTSMETALTAANIPHVMPAKWTVKGWYIVILNDGAEGAPYYNGTINSSDLTWFQTTFSGDTTPIILVSHHPLNSSGTGGGGNIENNASDYIATFTNYGNVKVLLTGHDHDNLNRTKQNVTWILAGRRGGSWWGVNQGFSILDIQPNHMIHRTVRDDGVSTGDDFYMSL